MTLDVVMRARNRRWNSPNHIFCLEEHRVIEEVLFNCVTSPKDSIFGEFPDLYGKTEVEFSANRVKLKASAFNVLLTL